MTTTHDPKVSPPAAPVLEAGRVSLQPSPYGEVTAPFLALLGAREARIRELELEAEVLRLLVVEAAAKDVLIWGGGGSRRSRVAPTPRGGGAMTEHGPAFFDQIRADLAAEGVVIQAADWLIEATGAPPDARPPRPAVGAWYTPPSCEGPPGGTCFSLIPRRFDTWRRGGGVCKGRPRNCGADPRTCKVNP